MSNDDDVLKILDGNVEQVKAGLVGLTVEQLGELLKAETDGKTRKGVISAIEAALTPEKPAKTDSEFGDLPTVEKARAMFEARPDLASVVTVEGTLNRDGSFSSKRTLGLDGIWR